MRIIVIFLPILILALFESTIIPLNFTLLAIISWSVLRPAKEVLLIAFVSGLILDLLTGKILGSSSLLFLIISLVIFLYKNRFQASRLSFLLPFTFFSVALTNLVLGLPPLSISVILTTILIVFFLPIFNFFSKVIKRNEQLKLFFEERI